MNTKFKRPKPRLDPGDAKIKAAAPTLTDAGDLKIRACAKQAKRVSDLRMRNHDNQ